MELKKWTSSSPPPQPDIMLTDHNWHHREQFLAKRRWRHVQHGNLMLYFAVLCVAMWIFCLNGDMHSFNSHLITYGLVSSFVVVVCVTNSRCCNPVEEIALQHNPFESHHIIKRSQLIHSQHLPSKETAFATASGGVGGKVTHYGTNLSIGDQSHSPNTNTDLNSLCQCSTVQCANIV